MLKYSWLCRLRLAGGRWPGSIRRHFGSVRHLAHGRSLWRNRRSGTHSLQSAQNHEVPFSQPFAENTEPFAHRTDVHRPILRFVVFSEDVDIFLVQVRDDGIVFRKAAAVTASAF